MVEVKQVEVEERNCLGIKVDLPRAPLLLLACGEVLVGCGYFDVEAMEKMDDKACIVTGVEDFDQLLNSEIQDFTSGAGRLGARKGLKVEDFIRDL